MHGTVEWLPGAPLGNSGFSWSDVLLGGRAGAGGPAGGGGQGDRRLLFGANTPNYARFCTAISDEDNAFLLFY